MTEVSRPPEYARTIFIRRTENVQLRKLSRAGSPTSNPPPPWPGSAVASAQRRSQNLNSILGVRLPAREDLRSSVFGVAFVPSQDRQSTPKAFRVNRQKKYRRRARF